MFNREIQNMSKDLNWVCTILRYDYYRLVAKLNCCINLNNEYLNDVEMYNFKYLYQLEWQPLQLLRHIRNVFGSSH